MIEGDAATSPASAVDARSGCGLGWPIPFFPCQCRPRNTRLRKVPRATDDAGGIVVVVREVQPIWCFEDAGSGTSSQVKSSVRTEKWSPATFTEPSSKSGVGGVPVVAQRRAGEFPDTVPGSRGRGRSDCGRDRGSFRVDLGTKRMECRGGLEGKKQDKNHNVYEGWQWSRSQRQKKRRPRGKQKFRACPLPRIVKMGGRESTGGKWKQAETGRLRIGAEAVPHRLIAAAVSQRGRAVGPEDGRGQDGSGSGTGTGAGRGGRGEERGT